MKILSLQNRQRTRPVDLRLLRRIARCLLEELLDETDYELGLHLVNAPEMSCVNETYLHHAGSTDVITFDYGSNVLPASRRQGQTGKTPLHGELFISIDDAVRQAKEFRTTWPSELVRYLVHGILHLEGHNDLQSAARTKMKRSENRLLQELARRFPLSQLHRRVGKPT